MDDAVRVCSRIKLKTFKNKYMATSTQSQQSQSGYADCDKLKDELNKKRKLLSALEDELEKYLNSGKCDLGTINNTAGLINATKSTIMELESGVAKCDPGCNEQKPGDDSQSIISSAVGRRKLASETEPVAIALKAINNIP
jgi:hypothetical protein